MNYYDTATLKEEFIKDYASRQAVAYMKLKELQDAAVARQHQARVIVPWYAYLPMLGAISGGVIGAGL